MAALNVLKQTLSCWGRERWLLFFSLFCGLFTVYSSLFALSLGVLVYVACVLSVLDCLLFALVSLEGNVLSS